MRALRCCAVLGVILCTSAMASEATITIDAAKAGPTLNPRMYGIFLEEINHGVDGGLYAEMVANRAFEDSRPPEGFVLKDGRWKSKQGWDSGFDVKAGQVPRWSLVLDGPAKGSMTLETTGGLNQNTPYCLRLDVQDASAGRIGIANQGFWGMGVRQNTPYSLSLHMRSDGSYSGPVTVQLEANGKPCSDAVTFSGVRKEWKRFTGTLNGQTQAGNARLVITAGGKGTLWFDFVSLFPRDTFRSRPNGLRTDIAEMIAQLKPGFVRFPGGCVVEGGNIESAYNWKLTTGPVEQRPERWNAWNYRRTHGMGLYEYLQFCEDLGAEPMWVGFAGQSCLYRLADHVPMEQMNWVLQNFHDIIEYANGSADTQWGGLRARSGHARPFGLKLIEIGNENGMQQYEERYKLIHAALKSAHPEITYLADYAIPGASYDMVDDHFYNSPQWFLADAGRYDRRSRTAPPVYVGEVAVTSAEGGNDKGNLISALAEGVYLMGMERNADVVRMVSYAPLLAHVSGRSGWHGMIYFDSLRAYGTVSYHLWKMFGTNRPTYTVQTKVEQSGLRQPAIAGSVGVGTWDTAAEYKDIRVEQDGKVLYTADFQKDTAGWKTDGGKWAIADGAYRQSDRAVGLSYVGDSSWSDYTLTLKARKLSGAEGFLVVFGRKGEDKYWWNIGGWGNREHGIEFNRGPVGRRVAGTIETNRWYDIKVQLTGRRIRCYLDGKLIHDETAQGVDRFVAQAGYDQASGELIIKAINTAEEPVTASFNIAGIDRLPGQASVTVLSSDRLDDNNTMQQPTRVVPTESLQNLQVTGNELKMELRSRSLTVIRLKAKRI